MSGTILRPRIVQTPTGGAPVRIRQSGPDARRSAGGFGPATAGRGGDAERRTGRVQDQATHIWKRLWPGSRDMPGPLTFLEHQEAEHASNSPGCALRYVRVFRKISGQINGGSGDRGARMSGPVTRVMIRRVYGRIVAEQAVRLIRGRRTRTTRWWTGRETHPFWVHSAVPVFKVDPGVSDPGFCNIFGTRELADFPPEPTDFAALKPLQM